jgi:hypothetical protein
MFSYKPKSTIDGTINIPIDEVRSRINELSQSKTIYVYCQIGLRGYLASKILLQMALIRYLTYPADTGSDMPALKKRRSDSAIVKRVPVQTGLASNSLTEVFWGS